MGYMKKLLRLIGTTARMAPSAIGTTSIEYTATPSSQYRICSGLLDTGTTKMGCATILRTKNSLETRLSLASEYLPVALFGQNHVMLEYTSTAGMASEGAGGRGAGQATSTHAAEV